MSKSVADYYSPILNPCCMGPELPKQDTDLKGYFRDYRTKKISRFFMPPYDWGAPRGSYAPRPDTTMTLRSRLRSLTVPKTNISTIDAARMKEVDDLYMAVQAHRDQTKDYSGKLHPLDFFKTNKYNYQCAPSLISSYFIRYPTSYTKYKVPPVLPLTYERVIETPCRPDLVLTGIYDRTSCIAWKR
ncbi:hypothetical protein KPH14_005802 [Odynerus spinipes]|uniref:Uncharacterized protein n=1 Tax=Odynerus spinipes TaxID=1348599 RepID=A0AAD9RCF6_9HYME|nr:hypothetical protein KPH14_005802 [Odynerus spinipes]